MAIPRRLVVLVLLFAVLSPVAMALEFRSATIGLSEAWTGNGYKPDPSDPDGPYDFDVTGSEGIPIDTFIVAGARFSPNDGQPATSDTLFLSPLLQIGARRYLLYENGRVVPAPVETALGDDENNEPGLGSARVVTLRAAAPIGFQVWLGGADDPAKAHALAIGFSPTLVLRFRAGDLETRDGDASDLNPMYTFFYGRLRFLMPEVHLEYRFPVSPYLHGAIQVDYGVSILDLFDTSLPVYDQMRLQIAVRIDVLQPFSGLFRDDAPEISLPESTD